MTISKLTLSTLTLGVALVITACGDKTANNNTADKSAQTQATASKKDPTTLTINNGAEISSLDPHKTGGVPESSVARQQFIGLTSTDADGKLTAGMAESWSSDDNITWTFKLRDAKWSNGEPVTAEDFVYSFQRMVNPKTAANFANFIADAKILNASEIIEGKLPPEQIGVKALDDKTVVITLSEPVPYFPQMAAYTAMRPVPKKVVEQFGDDAWAKPENIVVNGAYIIKDWKVGEKMVFAKNPNFYDADNVAIDNLILLPIDSGPTDYARYQANEIDITFTDVPSDILAAANKDEVKTSPSFCSYYYEMNVNKPPFNDVRVRRAMSLALDRETIAEKVAARGEIPSYQMTPTVVSNNPNYTPDWQKLDKTARINEAKRLLNEAGYNESNPLKFDLLYNTSENHKKVAVAAQSLWHDALGFVKVNLVNQEWKAYLASRRNHEHQMARAAWCGDYDDPAAFLNVMRTDGSGNYGDYSNKDYDNLLKTSLTKSKDSERAAVYHELEAILDKDVPNVWVYYQVNARAVKPYVQGYSTQDALGNWQARYWSIK